jgi:AcrR family transcriptional regulator
MFTLSTFMKPQNVDAVNIEVDNAAMANQGKAGKQTKSTKRTKQRDDRRGYHHPDLKHALLEGAVKLIEEEGLKAFSLRKLAMRVGVSHAAPYRHFESKEHILLTLMLEGHRRLRSTLLAAAERCQGTAVDKLMALSRGYLEFARENPEYLRVMFSAEAKVTAINADPCKHEEAHGSDTDSFAVVEETIRQCQQEGYLPKNADVGALGLLTWAEVHGLALLSDSGLIAIMSEMRGGSERKTLETIFGYMRARLEKQRPHG